MSIIVTETMLEATDSDPRLQVFNREQLKSVSPSVFSPALVSFRGSSARICLEEQ